MQRSDTNSGNSEDSWNENDSHVDIDKCWRMKTYWLTLVHWTSPGSAWTSSGACSGSLNELWFSLNQLWSLLWFAEVNVMVLRRSRNLTCGNVTITIQIVLWCADAIPHCSNYKRFHWSRFSLLLLNVYTQSSNSDNHILSHMIIAQKLSWNFESQTKEFCAEFSSPISIKTIDNH